MGGPGDEARGTWFPYAFWVGSLVAVSNDGMLEVIERRHIVVAEAQVPGSKQRGRSRVQTG